MFTALLLPLLAAGDPAAAGTRVETQADPAVQLWISNDRRFLPGDRAKVHVRAEDDGYLIVLHADADGYLRVLFPLDPGDDHFVRGGRKYEVKGRGGREAFTADVTGRGTVYTAVSRAPFHFSAYVVGDHWDYRALSPERLPREPESELTAIVRLMAGASFDYDILTYDVIERVVYADNYYTARPSYGSYYGGFYDDPWCGGYYFRRCSGLSVGIFFGTPFRRHYRPYFYGYHPFYDPFFYDPYYYRPVYFHPYPFPYRHYGYHRPFHSRYRDFYSFPRYRDRAYNPYRFRGKDGFQGDFRDRHYGFRRAVNTVYHPPVTRLRDPETATPARRLVDERAVAGPVAEDSRREVTRRDTERRATTARGGAPEARPAREQAAPRRSSAADRAESTVERRQVEARRSREPEGTPGVMPDARERRDRSVQEVRGRAIEVDRPAVERRSVERRSVERTSEVQARPVPRAVDRAEPARTESRSAGPRSVESRSAQPRSYDAPGRSSGGGRVERSSPPRSSADGGRRSSGDGGRGSPGGGGGRRR